MQSGVSDGLMDVDEAIVPRRRDEAFVPRRRRRPSNRSPTPPRVVRQRVEAPQTPQIARTGPRRARISSATWDFFVSGVGFSLAWILSWRREEKSLVQGLIRLLPQWYVEFVSLVAGELAGEYAVAFFLLVVGAAIIVLGAYLTWCEGVAVHATAAGVIVTTPFLWWGIWPLAASLRPLLAPVILSMLALTEIRFLYSSLENNHFLAASCVLGTLPTVLTAWCIYLDDAFAEPGPHPQANAFAFQVLFAVIRLPLGCFGLAMGLVACLNPVGTSSPGHDEMAVKLLPGLGCWMLGPLLRGDSRAHRLLAFTLWALLLACSYRGASRRRPALAVMGLVLLVGLSELVSRGEASNFSALLDFVGLEAARVVLGLVMELAVVQCHRTAHFARWKCTFALLSAWIGLSAAGCSPAFLTACRRFFELVVLAVCSAAVGTHGGLSNSMGTAGKCWDPAVHLRACGTWLLLIPTLIGLLSLRIRHRIASGFASAGQQEIPQLVRVGSVQLLERARTPTSRVRPVIWRMASPLTRQRLVGVHRTMLSMARQNLDYGTECVTPSGDGPLALARLLGLSLEQLWCARDMAALQQLLLPLRTFFGLPGRRFPHQWAIQVSRRRLLQDTFAVLNAASQDSLLANSIKVRFIGEHGIDVGGLKRDFFASAAFAMATSSSGLFVVGPQDVLMPKPLRPGAGRLPVQERAQYTAVGKFLGLALVQRQPLPLHFAAVYYNLLLGLDISGWEVKLLDPQFFEHRVESLLQDGGVAQMEAILMGPLFFTSVETAVRPWTEPLLPGGEKLRVTEENKSHYVQLLCEHFVAGGMREQIDAIVRGFHSVVPLAALLGSGIDARDLELLLAGCPEIDVAEWQTHAKVNAETPQQEQVALWFWECMNSIDTESRARLLAFATGSARVPPGGFASMGFEISFDRCATHLPTAHTCAHQLTLPVVDSKRDLEKKLEIVIREGVGFGFN